MGVLRKIFKSYSEKEVKRVMPIVEQINKFRTRNGKINRQRTNRKN